MNQHFTFDSYSKTIRLMPQNYLVATTEKGHIVVDADAAIEDVLAARIFILLRQHELKFSKDMNNILASLDLLLTDNAVIFAAMGQYLSDDEENYPAILEALTEALNDQPGTMIDFIEYPSGDGVNVETINVWEKVQMR